MKLSQYLSYTEATRSQTAVRKGIINKPGSKELSAMKYIAAMVFDKVREYIGGPLFASSFFRSPKLNEAIGGSTTSQHCKGEAIDIDADYFGVSNNRDIFFYILMNLPFDQLIWEFGDDEHPAWVHVSLKRTCTNRGQVLRAYKGKNGITRYKPFDL